MIETSNLNETYTLEFAKAYEEYKAPLFERSLYKINDRLLADDLVQNTFLKTWQYIRKSKKIISMRAFLFHVLNDLIIDEYRKKKPIPLEVLTENGFQIVIDDSRRLMDSIDGRKATLLISKLNGKYKDVLKMKYEKEMTLEEIAKATGQSKNTVAVQIHRGTHKLSLLFRRESLI
jgi:RNA polymerase sigma-70 factor (ECF subfamily)